MAPKPKRPSTSKTKINPLHTPRTPRTVNKTTNKTTTSPETITMKKTPTPKRKAIRHHACRLSPPCKQGHGGPAKTILPIGKYFFSEEALEHDLGALKRGAVYNDEKEFYKRVKAWYKAEVDRLMHRKLVESEAKKEKEGKELDKIMIRPTAMTRSGAATKGKLAATSDADDIDLSDDRSTSDSADSPSDSEYSDFEDKHLRKLIALRATTPIRKNPQALQTPSPSLDKPTPARVQPSRAAKRKAETPLLPPTPPKTPSPKRRKVTLIIKRSNPEPDADQPENNPEETKGDYSLSKLDFDESQPSYADRDEMADGVDVAYFMISLEKAVEGAINELVAARLGNGVLSLSSPRESSQGGIRARWRRLGSISHAGGQGRIVQESKDEEEVFEPAGDAVLGEDWRPPQPPRSAPLESGKGGKKGVKMQKGLELRIASKEGTPAPEAVMEPSPTLGRWQLADKRASGSSGLGSYERSKAGDMVKLKVEVESRE